MAKQPTASKFALVTRNVSELGKRLPSAEKVLIHFTKEQWVQATKNLKTGDTLPKRGVIFTYTPLPDDSGGIGQGDCIAQPCQICRIRQRPTPDGFGIECICRRDPDCPITPPPPPPPAGTCHLVLRRQGLNWRFVCESVNCGGRCQVQIVRQGPRSVISCACQ